MKMKLWIMVSIVLAAGTVAGANTVAASAATTATVATTQSRRTRIRGAANPRNIRGNSTAIPARSGSIADPSTAPTAVPTTQSEYSMRSAAVL